MRYKIILNQWEITKWFWKAVMTNIAFQNFFKLIR